MVCRVYANEHLVVSARSPNTHEYASRPVSYPHLSGRRFLDLKKVIQSTLLDRL